MATADFDRVRVEDALARFAVAPSGLVRLSGYDLGEGALGALFNAERLAAASGVVPWVTLADGSQAVVDVGAARAKIDSAPEAVRRLYLTCHGVVRQAHAHVAPANPSTPPLEGGGSLGGVLDDGELGLEPITAVVIVVIAVAAVIGTASYFTKRREIEVAGENLRYIELTSRVCALAEEQLRTTGEIDPNLVSTIGDLGSYATAEERAGGGIPTWMLVVGGVALAGGAYAERDRIARALRRLL